MFECFHCGQRAVIWDNDFNAEDYGYSGRGIVHALHCSNCGAIIEYILMEEDDEQRENEKRDPEEPEER